MSFAARILPLLSGNLLAQVLQIAAIPLLTRLYGPERYGEYGMFAAALMFSGMLATMRYELAIQLPRNDRTAFSIASLASLIAACVAFVVFLLGIVWVGYVNPRVDAISFASLLGVSTFLVGIFNIANALALRVGHYKWAGFGKVAQVSASVGCAFSAYLVGYEALGLLFANALGYLAGCALMLLPLGRYFERRPGAGRVLARLRGVAGRYSSFAIFNAPQAFMDGLRPMAIVSIVQFHYGAAATGFYHVANQLMQTPAAAVTQAVSQVHFRMLVEKCGGPDLRRYLLRVLVTLVAIAAVGAAVVMYLPGQAVQWVFGPSWTGVEKTMAALLPVVAANFVVAPLVYVFHVARRHREFLLWGAAYNGLAVFSIAAGGAGFGEMNTALLSYAICAGGVLCILGVRAVKLTSVIRSVG